MILRVRGNPQWGGRLGEGVGIVHMILKKLKFHNDSQLLRVASGQHTMGAQFYIYVTVVKDLYENCNAQNVK